jgi:hypothetical protein
MIGDFGADGDPAKSKAAKSKAAVSSWAVSFAPRQTVPALSFLVQA